MNTHRSRNRKSAKKAGTKFETDIANFLAQQLEDDRIERRAKTGSKDKGDITGVRHNGQRVVIECKNVARLNLADWMRQAQLEATNDEAPIWLVVHKRHGDGTPANQYVTMTLETAATLLGATKPKP